MSTRPSSPTPSSSTRRVRRPLLKVKHEYLTALFIQALKVKHEYLTALFIQALKELHARVASLEQRVAELELQCTGWCWIEL